MTSPLSEREMADLCAFADGTLAAERRDEVAAWVAASPELLVLVERQRRSLTATSAVASEQAPASLAAAIAARRRPAPARRGRRRLGLALSATAVVAAVVMAFVILSVSGGPGGPTVADAAQFALEPPSGPPPTAVGGTDRLSVDVQGLPFPDLSRALGWRATGVRHGRVAGRDATVVYYQRGTRRMAYAIVATPALPTPSAGQITTLAGVRYLSLSLRGRPVVTWRRLGHTCVMTGTASPADLLALAAWRGDAAAGY